jgi:hypothetical protein
LYYVSRRYKPAFSGSPSRASQAAIRAAGCCTRRGDSGRRGRNLGLEGRHGCRRCRATREGRGGWVETGPGSLARWVAGTPCVTSLAGGSWVAAAAGVASGPGHSLSLTIQEGIFNSCISFQELAPQNILHFSPTNTKLLCRTILTNTERHLLDLTPTTIFFRKQPKYVLKNTHLHVRDLCTPCSVPFSMANIIFRSREYIRSNTRTASSKANEPVRCLPYERNNQIGGV